jgi:hypothetical protein
MSTQHTSPEFSSGSYWHRWDPHLHAPGTLLNDQFGGTDEWNDYLTRLEQAQPPIEAIGVTDYYTLASYERVVDEKSRGRLANIPLVFPNVEMRLTTATVKGNAVNIHLLVSPEDPNHLVEAKRFLARLTFEAFGDRFGCSDDQLVALGGRAGSNLQGRAAMMKGANQFKIGLSDLKNQLEASNWAQQNIFIAVAGTGTDGTSGVRDDQYQVFRAEIEKFAHVIFASSAKQRDFWIGDGAVSLEELQRRYDGPKPCLHGCDAHEMSKVGVPDGSRYTWIKGVVAFDTLRQALIDPKGRAFVGPQPPTSTIASQAIASITIADADWAMTPRVCFNPGLVAIIGARGSGKTALAEITALGCDSISESQSENSFLRRAADLLTGVAVSLAWQSGEKTSRQLIGASSSSAERYPRARYLSQQFVEELCASDRMTDGLLEEIQRVIFEAHPLVDRDGASNFDELLELRVGLLRERRRSEQAVLAELSEQIGTDREQQRQVPSIQAVVDEKVRLIGRYKADRAKLVSKGSEDRVKRLDDLTQAAETVRGRLRQLAGQKQSLLSLRQEVADHRTRKAPEAVRQSKVRHQASGLNDECWERFLLEFKGNVDEAITACLQENERQTKLWKGTVVEADHDLTKALIEDGAVLTEQPLALLEAEIARVQVVVNVDKDTALKFAAISRRIDEEAAALGKLKEKVTNYKGADERIKSAQQAREAAYRRVFETISEEQGMLSSLYEPLRDRLKAKQGAAGKLSFTVKRTVDVAKWAREGESHLDLRVSGAFKGRGALQGWAELALKPSWEQSDPASVSDAMARFFADNRESLLGSDNIPPTGLANHLDWLMRFAKWLYGTQHISLEYGIDYDGTDIRKLSPGTRGIVLLLLYLALDEADDRPLIIDQPEENLDPKSIYEELVPLFRAAKARRQVILVTHNANLVVNTDADQVIVAQAGAHAPGELPPITYTSGGLEVTEIRKLVCSILEGGEAAFCERARRLRVRLER